MGPRIIPVAGAMGANAPVGKNMQPLVPAYQRSDLPIASRYRKGVRVGLKSNVRLRLLAQQRSRRLRFFVTSKNACAFSLKQGAS